MTTLNLREISRKAEDAGWQVRRTKNGHVCFLSPDKHVGPIFVSSTPSDWRAIHKIKAHFKRSGLDLDES